MNESYRDVGKTHPMWELTQIRVDYVDLDKILLQYGDGGWELVAAIRIPTTDPVYYRLFFKRMK